MKYLYFLSMCLFVFSCQSLSREDAVEDSLPDKVKSYPNFEEKLEQRDNYQDSLWSIPQHHK